ncbi:hypothetical protein ACH79_30320 [Bradyrhizobium sp. CCBAU 051011]|uniref:hypothetical protein n=1 Tax=Bradyrhizobium sp. CCBAU 051011 TaxID=858422 RepID=UPI0013743CA0|nr:hypothetical protein [Bradyrhizobium sp. CCBAU 051011]QHO76262.1 hypothetical protein ACH79_30320 [Bradyrhizobium sp. CCBAU 051011]
MVAIQPFDDIDLALTRRLLKARVKLAWLEKLSASAVSTKGRSPWINNAFARSRRLALTHTR